ncbi:MAG: hypothetical protein WBK97_05735 [Bacteroidales bacterium]|jgi:hypothetical protein
MKVTVNESIKKAIKKAIATGMLDLLTIPDMEQFLKNYVDGVENMNDIVSKSYKREGKVYKPEQITAPVEVKDRGSLIALIGALKRGVLEIPQAWIDKARELNEVNLFLEIMKKADNKSGN